MEPNESYPNQKPEDFSHFYDPESSDIPWMTTDNCSVCGRIRNALNPEITTFPSFTVGSQKRYYVACSSKCRSKLFEWQKEEIARNHQ